MRTEGEKRDKGTGLGAREKRGEGGIGSRGGRRREIERQRVGKTEENGVGREEQRGTGSGAKKSFPGVHLDVTQAGLLKPHRP